MRGRMTIPLSDFDRPGKKNHYGIEFEGIMTQREMMAEGLVAEEIKHNGYCRTFFNDHYLKGINLIILQQGGVIA